MPLSVEPLEPPMRPQSAFPEKIKAWAKKEVIRAYDNSKFRLPDWYGRKDYAHLTDDEVNARLAEITIEKASRP